MQEPEPEDAKLKDTTAVDLSFGPGRLFCLENFETHMAGPFENVGSLWGHTGVKDPIEQSQIEHRRRTP